MPPAAPDPGARAAVSAWLGPEPVKAALTKRCWALTHILNTHHHLDHTGGNLALKDETGAQVVGPEGVWGDKLPRIVQSKLVEAFENSGKLGGVGMPGQGLAIDYQIVTDIRSFEIDASNGNQAVDDNLVEAYTGLGRAANGKVDYKRWTTHAANFVAE